MAAPAVPPQFLPMFVTGYLVYRNLKRKRGAARVSTASTRARRSTPGGMDGEGYAVRNRGRGRSARCVPHR